MTKSITDWQREVHALAHEYQRSIIIKCDSCHHEAGHVLLDPVQEQKSQEAIQPDSVTERERAFANEIRKELAEKCPELEISLAEAIVARRVRAKFQPPDLAEMGKSSIPTGHRNLSADYKKLLSEDARKRRTPEEEAKKQQALADYMEEYANSEPVDLFAPPTDEDSLTSDVYVPYGVFSDRNRKLLRAEKLIDEQEARIAELESEVEWQQGRNKANNLTHSYVQKQLEDRIAELEKRQNVSQSEIATYCELLDAETARRNRFQKALEAIANPQPIAIHKTEDGHTLEHFRDPREVAKRALKEGDGNES